VTSFGFDLLVDLEVCGLGFGLSLFVLFPVFFVFFQYFSSVYFFSVFQCFFCSDQNCSIRVSVLVATSIFTVLA